MPRISLIVAMSQNRVIGRDGGLPWRLSADLQRFKALTMGHHLIMGRKTFDSIGRVLPGRTSIVLTRQANLQPPEGVLVAHNLDAAIALAQADDEVFIIGGGEIFRLALPQADRLYLTLVEAEVSGDPYFPEIEPADWSLVSESPHGADGKNEYPHRFRVYQRKSLL